MTSRLLSSRGIRERSSSAHRFRKTAATTMLYSPTRAAKRLCDNLTVAHAVLRREASVCLNAVASMSEGELTDADRAARRARRFITLASGYCAVRRTQLWPLLEQLVPTAHAEFVLLADSGLTLESDLATMSTAIEELLGALRSKNDGSNAASRIALHSIQPAKILHDSLSLHLGDEELLLCNLFSGFSRREMAAARRSLGHHASSSTMQGVEAAVEASRVALPT